MITNERGVGYIVDMLIFALILSSASLLLLVASPTESETQSVRHATTLAQSTLLALQHATAGEFSGFQYQLGVFGFDMNLPIINASSKRKLDNKTFLQLLIEDALLNLCIEVAGVELTLINPNQDMSEKLRELLKGTLDKMIGGRFGYRLAVKALPLDSDHARIYFETEIKSLDKIRRKLCSETIIATLPVPREELTELIKRTIGAVEFELNPVVEITLELWSP